MSIRVAKINDSELLIKLFKSLDQETSFMLLEPSERDSSVENQEKQMANFADSNSQVMFVKENENSDLVGFVVGVAGNFIRNKHSLYCVIGVMEEYHGKGIGQSLLINLEKWAKSHSIHRIELTVMEHNVKAIRLYESFGFIREGIKRDSICISGEFVNELYMSKLLNASQAN